MSWPDGIDWTVLACGAGTLLLRTLPFIAQRRSPTPRASSLARWWSAFTTAIGPSALGTLLVVSVWPLARGHEQRPDEAAVAVGVGLLAVWVTRARLGGLVGAMLAGALVYGVTKALLNAF